MTELQEKIDFIAEYAQHLMGCGIHTSRVIRNTKRVGESQGFDIKISTLSKTLIITLFHKETERFYSEVVEVPLLPISFSHNSELSALSWEAVDKKLPFASLKEKYYDITSSKSMAMWKIMFLVGLANTAFCRIFGGDYLAMVSVLVATLIGFLCRTFMIRRHINHYIVFIVTAFVSSLIASSSILFSATSDVAIATSVLFLIPGVPLINGFIDILEGHSITGIGRLTNACLLIVSISIGLYITLILFKDSLI